MGNCSLHRGMLWGVLPTCVCDCGDISPQSCLSVGRSPHNGGYVGKASPLTQFLSFFTSIMHSHTQCEGNCECHALAACIWYPLIVGRCYMRITTMLHRSAAVLMYYGMVMQWHVPLCNMLCLGVLACIASDGPGIHNMPWTSLGVSTYNLVEQFIAGVHLLIR